MIILLILYDMVTRVINDKIILKLVFPHNRENELRIIASKNEN